MPNLETPAARVAVPVLPAAPADPAKEAPPAEQRLLLRGLDWTRYRKISEALTGVAVQLPYDRGELELVTTSRLHEIFSRCIGLLINVLAEEFGLSLDGCGRMTCDREDLERGIEPDECFYITHEPAVRGKAQLDLSTDPPPDLGIEVDISRGSLVRMPIYAALGVPEVWAVRWPNFDVLSSRREPAVRRGQAEHVFYRRHGGTFAAVRSPTGASRRNHRGPLLPPMGARANRQNQRRNRGTRAAILNGRKV